MPALGNRRVGRARHGGPMSVPDGWGATAGWPPWATTDPDGASEPAVPPGHATIRAPAAAVPAAPTDPPTTSPPTTIDVKALCALLESQKQAIEAEIKRVEEAYKDDPVTRDRLRDELEVQKHAVEQQRKAAHC